MRYVALGDSYTIGSGVPEVERWPNQLVARVESLELGGNLAAGGSTSRDVLEQQLPRLDRMKPEFVTLLVGCNDVAQAVADWEYAGNVSLILEELRALLPAERILCAATPDHTVTPRGADLADPMQESDGIVRANAILREACEGRDIRFVPDIFEMSQGVMEDPSLVADDGLHPSGRQYALWVDVIAPVVEDLLSRPGAGRLLASAP